MKIVSENQFSGKTYFYTIASRAKRRSSCEPDIFPSISSRIDVHAVRHTDDASTWTQPAPDCAASGDSGIGGGALEERGEFGDEEEDFVAEVRVWPTQKWSEVHRVSVIWSLDTWSFWL